MSRLGHKHNNQGYGLERKGGGNTEIVNDETFYLCNILLSACLTNPTQTSFIYMLSDI